MGHICDINGNVHNTNIATFETDMSIYCTIQVSRLTQVVLYIWFGAGTLIEDVTPLISTGVDMARHHRSTWESVKQSGKNVPSTNHRDKAVYDIHLYNPDLSNNSVIGCSIT